MMNSKIDVRELSEHVVDLVNKTTSKTDAINLVYNYLNLYMIGWKKVSHELSYENAKWRLKWDYHGWKNNGHFYNSQMSLQIDPQSDWNNTLLTKLNQISAQISQSSFNGGAGYIKTHPSMEKLFKTMEYYYDSIFCGRFSVELDDTVKIDEIFIYHKDWNNIKFLPIITTKEDDEFGELKFRHISICTNEEVSEYNTKLLGVIKIDNYEENK